MIEVSRPPVIPAGRPLTPTEQYELQRWLETVTLAVKELQTASAPATPAP